MKIIKNTNSFYVLGVKFENIQEAIEYAIEGLDKNGVFVGMMPSYILALIPKIMHQKTGSFGISCLQDLKRNWIENS